MFRGRTLARSPPTSRSTKTGTGDGKHSSTRSQKSLIWDTNDVTVIEVSEEDQDGARKAAKVRKRTGSSPTPDVKRKKGALTCLLNKVEELQKLVASNTRKEIKSAITSLGRITKSLNEDIETLIERVSFLEAEQQQGRSENRSDSAPKKNPEPSY